MIPWVRRVVRGEWGPGAIEHLMAGTERFAERLGLGDDPDGRETIVQSLRLLHRAGAKAGHRCRAREQRRHVLRAELHLARLQVALAAIQSIEASGGRPTEVHHADHSTVRWGRVIGWKALARFNFAHFRRVRGEKWPAIFTQWNEWPVVLDACEQERPAKRCTGSWRQFARDVGRTGVALLGPSYRGHARPRGG